MPLPGSWITSGAVPGQTVGALSNWYALNVVLNALGSIPVSVRAASATLALADYGELVELSAAAGVTLTVPPNSTVPLPVGSVIGIAQVGAGRVTVAPGVGVTVQWHDGLVSGTGSKALAGQHAEAVLTKRATDTWRLSGLLLQ